MFAYDRNHVAVLVCGRFGRHSNGPITIAIRARFEYDSTTIRLRFGYNTLRDAYDSSTIQHPTRSYVLSSNNEHVNSFAML